MPPARKSPSSSRSENRSESRSGGRSPARTGAGASERSTDRRGGKAGADQKGRKGKDKDRDRDRADRPRNVAPVLPSPEEMNSPKRSTPYLSSRQRVYLRGLGHHLVPVIQVGREGLTEGLCLATSQALLQHEIIKVRLSETALDSAEQDRHELAATLAERCRAALVQVVGRVALLYRHSPRKRAPDELRVELPRA